MSDLTSRERGLIADELRAQAQRLERYTDRLNPLDDAAAAALLDVARTLRDRADELARAANTAEPDPCAGLQVGDRYREDPDYCNDEDKHTLQLCSRPMWHPGNHVHAHWGEVLAVWPPDPA